MAPLDLAFTRRQFPAFDADRLGADAGRHFENAGGSWPCRAVVDALTGFYLDAKVQPGHPHPVAQEAQRRMDDARRRLAPWLGVDLDELHVGPSTTANTHVLADALRQVLPPGAAVVVTQQDHEANSGPWRRLAEAGFEVREWEVDPTTGRLDAAGLERLLDDRVEVVALPLVSNLVGEVNPVGAWLELVHAVGAIGVVDAVAAVPHAIPDVGDLGADVLLFSAYKVYGPHQGVMAVRRELLERLPNQGHFFNADQVHKRLVPAGPDHAQVAALAGVVDHLEALDAHHHPDVADRSPTAARERVNALLHEHERPLVGRMLAGLRDLGLEPLGPDDADRHAATISVRSTRRPAELAAELGRRGTWCAGGHFYAVRLCRALGIDPEHGVLRLSFVHYTSAEDVDRALQDVADAL